MQTNKKFEFQFEGLIKSAKTLVKTLYEKRLLTVYLSPAYYP